MLITSGAGLPHSVALAMKSMALSVQAELPVLAAVQILAARMRLLLPTPVATPR